MKRFMSVALAMVVAVTPVAAIADGALVEAEKNAVVTLGGYAGTTLEIGAGVAVASHGRTLTVLTAAHIARLTSLVVYFRDGSEGRVEHVQLPTTGTRDLAVLTIAEPAIGDAVPAHVATRSPELGDTLTMVGHPLGVRYIADEVTVIAPIGSATQIAVDCTSVSSVHCTNGDSGGPLFNASGEVVGIFSSFGSATRNATATEHASVLRVAFAEAMRLPASP